jgi:DNA end-binding protein Ku
MSPLRERPGPCFEPVAGTARTSGDARQSLREPPVSRADSAELMRALWKGSISFGLVTIPVALHTATKREELKFRLLRKSDLSPINYKRVAEVDGKEVPWEEIVKGYEYEKGRFVVITDEDFERVDLKSAETIDIMDFVDLAEINPIYFDKPYYLEPQKGGAGAYALLRDVLAKSNKAGIAKVVIRTRQHLAAVKANDKILALELMHFGDEILSPAGLKIPENKLGTREEEMALTLVNQMTEKWNPERYTDDYKTALMKVIEKKIEAGGKELPTEKPQRRAATNVIDLVEVLQRSLSEAARGGGSGGGGSATAGSATKRRGESAAGAKRVPKKKTAARKRPHRAHKRAA